MLLEVFPVGPIQANCVLLADGAGGPLAVIDPGGEPEVILERVRATGREVSHLIVTHPHLDHAAAVAELARALPAAAVALHREGLELYRGLPQQGLMFGLQVAPGPEPTLWLEHGQQLALGAVTLEVRSAPGHSPGSVVLIVHGATPPVAIVGDVLFAGSIGRTDLWGGSFDELERSIREQLYSLPDDTRVITGHGPDTTIGRERRGNPFVQG